MPAVDATGIIPDENCREQDSLCTERLAHLQVSHFGYKKSSDLPSKYWFFLYQRIKEVFYDVVALQRPTDRPAEGWISQGSAALLQGGTDLRLTPNVWPAVWRTARTWCCCSPAARRPVSAVRGSSLGRETLRSAIVSCWGDLGKHSLGCSSLE